MDTIFRKLPLFKGKERLARILLKNKIRENKNFWIKGKFGCEYRVPNVVENIGFEIFINGIYEKATSDFIINRLPRNGVYLDFGANIGAIAIPVQTRRKDVKIVCVEAAPWVYHFLKQNLERNNLTEVIALNNALFNVDDKTVNIYSPEEKFGKGSLSPVFTNKAVQVKTVKVDTLIKRLGLEKVDIIKIDVEGYEYHVFKGATSLLAGTNAPDILFEFSDWAEKDAGIDDIGASQQILIDLGYRIYYFNRSEALKEVSGILKKGFYMLFATKKTQ